MTFIELIHRNKPNITYFLKIKINSSEKIQPCVGFVHFEPYCTRVHFTVYVQIFIILYKNTLPAVQKPKQMNGRDMCKTKIKISQREFGKISIMSSYPFYQVGGCWP